jgi:putative transposase
LSIQYPHELHIIQVDNAPAHNLGSSELPDNIILLFQPPACPEVNPTERVLDLLKNFLAWSVFSNLDELRIKVQEILASFTPECHWFSYRMVVDFTFFISITSLKKWYYIQVA